MPITETNPGAPLPAPTRREEEEGWFACMYYLRYDSLFPLLHDGKTLVYDISCTLQICVSIEQ